MPQLSLFMSSMKFCIHSPKIFNLIAHLFQASFFSCFWKFFLVLENNLPPSRVLQVCRLCLWHRVGNDSRDYCEVSDCHCLRCIVKSNLEWTLLLSCLKLTVCKWAHVQSRQRVNVDGCKIKCKMNMRPGQQLIYRCLLCYDTSVNWLFAQCSRL